MKKLIELDAALEGLENLNAISFYEANEHSKEAYMETKDMLKALPTVQPTLYGYNIEHLELIARVLQKEDLPPERVVEALKDIGRIVAIVKDEFEETLRKAVEQCMI